MVWGLFGLRVILSLLLCGALGFEVWILEFRISDLGYHLGLKGHQLTCRMSPSSRPTLWVVTLTKSPDPSNTKVTGIAHTVARYPGLALPG